MPTWTDNTVYVTGSKEGLQAFGTLAANLGVDVRCV